MSTESSAPQSTQPSTPQTQAQAQSQLEAASAPQQDPKLQSGLLDAVVASTTSPSIAIGPSNLTPPDLDDTKYGGFTRFEIELEFVQTLANPMYLNFLASEKYFEKPEFVAYLNYLQYFTKPPYLQYLTYPGATLNNLMLLQREKFRIEILSPEVAMRLAEEILRASSAKP